MQWQEREVSFSNGATEVWGTLCLPTDAATPVPALTILDSDQRGGRDSEYYPQFAHFLAEHGIAALRYDSPGSGKSEGDSFLQSLADRATEAVAAVRLLQAQPAIRADAVGLWGLSEGALISAMVVAQSDTVAFIVPVSMSLQLWGLSEILEDVRAACGAAGQSDERTQRELLMIRLWQHYYSMTDADDARNRAEVAAFEDGPWTELLALLDRRANLTPAEELAALQAMYEKHTQQWPDYQAHGYFLNEVIEKNLTPEGYPIHRKLWLELVTTNPQAYLARVNCPVFAIWGADDEWLPVEENAAQFAGLVLHNDVQTKVYPAAGHGITGEGDVPAPGLFEDIVAWVQQHTA